MAQPTPARVCPACDGFASAAVTLGGRDRNGNRAPSPPTAAPATAPAPARPVAPPRPRRGDRVTDTATLAGLDPATLERLLRVAGSPGFDRWQDQVAPHRRLRRPDPPDRLDPHHGQDHRRDPAPLLHRHRARRTTPGRLRQPPRLPLPGLLRLRRDTYHLIRAGLRGGKGTSPTPSATTPASSPPSPPPASAPSTTAPTDAAAAAAAPATPTTTRPRHRRSTRRPTTTRARSCGTPTPAPCGTASPPTCAARSPPAPDSPNATFREHARVSFAKVAEYQKRGAVHFHAVIRLDGPDGPDTPPPAWATADLLTDAIRPPPPRVHRRHRARPPTASPHDLRAGAASSTSARSDAASAAAPSHRPAVAAYIAKYATKGAETHRHPRPPPRRPRRTRPASTSPTTPAA